MNGRAIAALLLLGGVAVALLWPIGPTVEERQTGHLKSGVAGVVARAAFASEQRLNMKEPAPVPSVREPDNRQTAGETSVQQPEPSPVAAPAVEAPRIEPPANPKPDPKPDPKPAPRQARAIIASPTWHCPHCDRQRAQVEGLSNRGYRVGKSDADDFQFLTLSDADARRLYGITRWPTTVILSADGRMLRSFSGVQSSERLEAELKAARR